jgi:hypothetical protein
MADSLNAAGILSTGKSGASVALSFGSFLAHVVERVARTSAALCDRAWRIARTPRKRDEDWRTAARELYLWHAVDVHDVERRQRAWDRDEASAYSMSGWS